MPSTYSPPCRVPSFLTALRLMLQIAATDPVAGEPLALEQPPGGVGLQERADRHACLQPPGRRADADEVVLAFACLVRDPDLAGRTAQLRRHHPEDVEIGVPEREAREAVRIALVGELDRGLPDLAAS